LAFKRQQNNNKELGHIRAHYNLMGHDLMHGHINPLIKTGILLEKFGRLLRWSVNWILH
jgi:hypothetical protein